MHNIFILFQKRINSRGYSQNSFAVPPIWSLCSVQLTVILFYSFYTLIFFFLPNTHLYINRLRHMALKNVINNFFDNKNEPSQ